MRPLFLNAWYIPALELMISLNYLGNPPLVQLIILSILYLYFEIELNGIELCFTLDQEHLSTWEMNELKNLRCK